MTVSSTLEAKLRGRGPSDTPVTSAGAVLGVEPSGDAGEERFGMLVECVRVVCFTRPESHSNLATPL